MTFLFTVRRVPELIVRALSILRIIPGHFHINNTNKLNSVVVISFLSTYGNGDNMPSGYIGQTCFVTEGGEGQDCTALAESITTCQAAGIKVILSLGGGNSYGYSLQSDAEAQQIGQYLWDAYANSGSTSVQRPFGDGVFVNGFDFDIEANGGSSQYYPSMISTLRSNFASDPDNTYVRKHINCSWIIQPLKCSPAVYHWSTAMPHP